MLHTCMHSTHMHTHTHIIDTLVDTQTDREITFAGSKRTGTPLVGFLANDWTRIAGQEKLETGVSDAYS